MLEFPATNGIQVYASDAGFICFKSTGDAYYQEQDEIVCLTIGQFRAVIKNSDKLIAEANANKEAAKAGDE
jgi:hypothetical protein